MWSGKMGGQGESYPTQWALNPSSQYLHVPHEQVDWARLAQQWIKMKEENPELVEQQQQQEEGEGGEAAMELSREDHGALATPVIPAVPWPVPPQVSTGEDGGLGWWTTGGWPGTGGYTGGHYPGGGGGLTESAVMDPTTLSMSAGSAPFPAQYSGLPTGALPPAAADYQPTPPVSHSNYWNEVRGVGGKETGSRSHRKHSSSRDSHSEPAPEIDAVKRKQLPAWIREGLEKMEREKLKKAAEQERLERERKEASLNPPAAVGLPQASLTGNGYEEPPKSKFETDSSESEGEEKAKPAEELRPRKSRFDVRQPSPPKPVFRTKEQILESTMTDVRKILTQILMEVTAEETKKVCEDVHRNFIKKAPVTALRKTPALTSLTGKLGLGIYGSDSESEGSADEKVTNEPDSDEELREKIERLRKEFASREKSIERQCEELEERERRQLLREKKASSEEPDTGQVHSQSETGPEEEKEPTREGDGEERLAAVEENANGEAEGTDEERAGGEMRLEEAEEDVGRRERSKEKRRGRDSSTSSASSSSSSTSSSSSSAESSSSAGGSSSTDRSSEEGRRGRGRSSSDESRRSSARRGRSKRSRSTRRRSRSRSRRRSRSRSRRRRQEPRRGRSRSSSSRRRHHSHRHQARRRHSSSSRSRSRSAHRRHHHSHRPHSSRSTSVSSRHRRR